MECTFLWVCSTLYYYLVVQDHPILLCEGSRFPKQGHISGRDVKDLK